MRSELILGTLPVLDGVVDVLRHEVPVELVSDTDVGMPEHPAHKCDVYSVAKQL